MPETWGTKVMVVTVVAMASGCSASAPYPTVTSVVDTARSDQLGFTSKYREQGIAFRGTVQKKGIKAATATDFDFKLDGLGPTNIGSVTGTGTSRRVNVNLGYVFLGHGSDEATRALCLFEPDNLKEAAALTVGQDATLTCLFSKFVGDDSAPTPVFWGCSVIP